MSQSDKNSRQYWYPNMGNADIIDSLDSWGLSVTHHQLVKPTPEFVLSVYCSCLQQVVDLSEDSLQEPVQAAFSSLDEPGMDLLGPISTNLLVYHIIRLADAAKVPNFSGKDIFTPTTERTRLILSAFINFVKFSEQSLPFVTNLRGKAADLIQERESVTHECARLEAQLVQLKAKRAEDEPRLDGIRQENVSITSQLIAYKETQTSLLRDIESLKVEKSALVQRKEGICADAALATDGVARLRGRVVHTANEDKRTFMSRQATIDELQSKVSALWNIEKDFRASVEQLQTLERETQALVVAEKVLTDSRDSHEKQKNERKGSLLRAEHMVKQLANARQKIERAQQHIEDKRLSSQQAIERLEKEYQNMALERRDTDKHNEELRAEADETERKMAEHLKRSEAELSELLAEYWALRNRTDYSQKTGDAGLLRLSGCLFFSLYSFWRGMLIICNTNAGCMLSPSTRPTRSLLRGLACHFNEPLIARAGCAAYPEHLVFSLFF
ncbi:Nuf2 family-domain-containing protein [Russula earlei]|uniref:Nuf2 family-domain-containing protein n=1 Tax=Russula earlei TaxID=71964 RepID=A0ACC0UC95_9AGAM|nr:Nuf2 family-domain-containing protein [Russula earlei]